MDAEDVLRARKHLAKLRDRLREVGVMTNHEVRRCAGSRGMGRVNELQKLGFADHGSQAVTLDVGSSMGRASAGSRRWHAH